MIYLIRQGQTDWNLLKKFNGITETELNQTGIEQARQQAGKLKEVSFDHCFCSPQLRARQTAEIIFHGSVMIDERLAEINCGEFEGTKETPESMRAFWHAVSAGTKGTESRSDFMQRNSEFCRMVMQEYQGENILIVTHAANARILNYCFSGKPENYDFSKAIAGNGEILTY